MNERLWTFHGYTWTAGPYVIRRGETPSIYLVSCDDKVIGYTETLEDAKAACAAHSADCE